jgi:hypothetical protein
VARQDIQQAAVSGKHCPAILGGACGVAAPGQHMPERAPASCVGVCFRCTYATLLSQSREPAHACPELKPRKPIIAAKCRRSAAWAPAARRSSEPSRRRPTSAANLSGSAATKAAHHSGFTLLSPSSLPLDRRLLLAVCGCGWLEQVSRAGVVRVIAHKGLHCFVAGQAQAAQRGHGGPWDVERGRMCADEWCGLGWG